MKLATILLSFPLTTERFITQELLYLKNNGLELHIFPLRKKPTSPAPPEASELLSQTHYLPFFSISNWLSLFYYIFSHPIRLVKVCWKIACHFPQPKTWVKLNYLLPKTALIARELQKRGITEVHAQWASLPATVAYFIAILNNSAYHFSAHASDIFTYENRFFLRQKTRAARFVITCSQYAQEFLVNFCAEEKDKEKIFTIYHGIKPEEYEGVDTCEINPPIICSGGRLVKKKGLIEFVLALGQLKQQGYVFQALIFGGGPEKTRLLVEIRNQQLEDEVRITGFLPHQELIDILRQSSMFVLPAVIQDTGNREGLSNLLLEAQALGKPVVASNISAIPELVEDGYNGYLIPPGDINALARAMITLLDDRELRCAMGQHGREKVAKDFNFYVFHSRLVQIYRKFTKEN